ncbi:MAG: hypothetical protein QNJ46_11685 [Leptolyngbyaceae cyanobacterium MO_188.B28]|nr:hypothetical protein [Leptolyngbyaceae cyanobacterium MO_188.B28]
MKRLTALVATAAIGSIFFNTTPLPAQQIFGGRLTSNEPYGAEAALPVTVTSEDEATRATQVQRAESILKQALQEIPEISKSDPSRPNTSQAHTMLAELAETCQTVKNTETIQPILELILTEAERLDASDSLEKSRLLVAIAKVYGHAEDKKIAATGLERTLELTQTLESVGFRSHFKSEALSTIAVAYSQQGDLTTAYKLLGQALEVAQSQESSYDTLEALWPIIGAHLYLRDAPQTEMALAQIDQILQILWAYDEETWPSGSLEAIPHIYIQLDNTETDEEKIAQVIAMAQRLDISDKFTLLQELASSLGYLNNLAVINEGLAQVLEAVQTSDISEEEVSWLLGGMKINVLIAIATTYGSIGEFEKANNTLVQALEFTKTLDEKSWPLRYIAMAFSQLGNTDSVRAGLAQTVQEARTLDSFGKTLTLIVIADAYEQLGEQDAAKAILAEALELATRFEGEMFNPQTLSSIAATYGRLSNTEMVEKVLIRALKSALMLGDDGWSSIEIQLTIPPLMTLEDLSVIRAGLGRTLEATKNIRDPILKSRTLIVIAAAYGQIGDFSTADAVLRQTLEVIKTIVAPSPLHFQAESLTGIISVYSQLDDSTTALDGLMQVLKFAETMPSQSEYKSEALRTIASTYQYLELPDVADQTLDKALAAANQIEAPRYRVEQSILIAKTYLQLASGVTEVLPNPLERFDIGG